MKDNLEEFISQNRDAFDVYEPSPDLWKKIEKQTGKKTIKLKTVLWRAAAVVVIFCASLIFHRYIDMVNQSQQAEINIPEVKEAEIYYTGMLSSKLDEIRPMLEEHPGLGKEIMGELTELDSIYNDLKSDLKDNVANQEVVEAMIQNYRMRLSILEDILNELKHEDNDKHEEYDVEI